MEYWQSKYYAGLLTAAMYHGASHQQPQTFQVAVEKNRRPIQYGRIKINFMAKKNLIATPTQTISNKISYHGHKLIKFRIASFLQSESLHFLIFNLISFVSSTNSPPFRAVEPLSNNLHC